MHAKDKSFSFTAMTEYYDIPFFQRPYVWDDKNWEELLDNLMDSKHEHFLGAIILKSEGAYSGSIPRYSVIDGQQRLTTLSILLRACYDHIEKNAESYDMTPDDVENDRHQMMKQLFVSEGGMKSTYHIKIKHSHLDHVAYEEVIKGELNKNDKWEKYAEIPKENNISKIFGAYIYFRKALLDASQDQVNYLWTLLTEDNKDTKMLVNITLGDSDNEQTIFDTVNSAGVPLSSADTIKNLIYQKYVDLVREDDPETADDRAVKKYNETWEKAFTENEDESTYWDTKRQYGRMKRSNLETFLHAFAVVLGFFNPAEDNMDTLPKKYKGKVESLSLDEMESFLSELHDYAEVFRKYFFGKEEPIGYDDCIKRIFNVCDALEVSTFYPYLLQQLYNHDRAETVSDDTLKANFKSLERYIILNAICSGSTKNYNNECLQMVSGKKSPADIANESIYITEDSFKNGLRRMATNKLPTLLLFWIELYKRSKSLHDQKELKYNYTLEHIMPQSWQKNWSDVPCYDKDGHLMTDKDAIESTRNHAIYEIGNMTLLNSRLNSSVSNGTFQDKCNGKNGKEGIRNLSDMRLTHEVVDNNHEWDERKIYDRTEELEKMIREIWNAQSLPTEVKVKKDAGKDRSEIRLAFWAYALPIIKEDNNYVSFANVNPTTYNFVNGSFGIGGCSITCTAGYDKARVDLYLGHKNPERNKKIFDMLLGYKQEIEESLGVALVWDRADNYKGSWISYTLEGVSILNKDDWKKMADFLGEWSRKFREIFVPYLTKEYPQNIWGSKSQEEIDRRAAIAAMLRKWVVNTTDTIPTDKCSVPYTRFTTKVMSEILPDTPGHLSGWTTENHYFYEIANPTDGRLYIQLSISSKNMTEDQKKVRDNIDKCVEIHRTHEDWDFWVAYKTGKIEVPEDNDEKILFERLNGIFEEIKEFETGLKQKLTEL